MATTFPSPAMAAAIRAATAQLLADSCQIARSGGHVADGAMGYTDALANVGSPVACLIQPARRLPSREDVDVGRIQVQSRYAITLAPGTVVKAQDRITQVSSGLVFLVSGPVDAQTAEPNPTVLATVVSI